MKHFNLTTLLTIVLSLGIGQVLFAQNAEYKLIHQGNRHFNLKQYDLAQNCYMQALKHNQQNIRAMFNLADTYLAKDNAGAADSLYNIVAQHDNNSQIKSMAWHNRGYIRQVQALHNPQQQQQLLRIAIDHYKQALRLNPKDNDTRYNLALCQKQLKDNPQHDNQQKQNQENKGQDNSPQQQKQNNPQQHKQPQQDKQQTEQYLNLVKQAEKRALEKLNGVKPRQKTLEKNW